MTKVVRAQMSSFTCVETTWCTVSFESQLVIQTEHVRSSTCSKHPYNHSPTSEGTVHCLHWDINGVSEWTWPGGSSGRHGKHFILSIINSYIRCSFCLLKIAAFTSSLLLHRLLSTTYLQLPSPPRPVLAFSCLWIYFKWFIYVSCSGERCDVAVKLQKCFELWETSPDFIRWVETDWSVTVGWTLPLRW